jgi:hypothetical protein
MFSKGSDKKVKFKQKHNRGMYLTLQWRAIFKLAHLVSVEQLIAGNCLKGHKFLTVFRNKAE